MKFNLKDVACVVELVQQGFEPRDAIRSVKAAAQADHVNSLIEAELPASRALILAQAHG